ncbi:MAG: hypothetical protein U5R14_07710 [Gemmatimonadota bacterium]|nr:hypothetical protein [Gemmatimonadota bacterium]
MRYPPAPPVAALLAAVLLAPAAVEAQEYYADVRPVLAKECMGCHSEDGIAWSMEDPEETFEERRRIAGAVTVRQMPPWLAEPGHQEYVGDMSLDEEVVGMVAAWRDAGYPKGEPRPDPEVEPANAPPTFRADLSTDVLGDTPYLPDQSMDDDYRCFVTEWTAEDRGYVTGFRTVPGNENVAHHTVVYAVDPEMVERFRELEDEEEGQGYQCFGGALPDRLSERAEREAYEARYPDGVRELSRASWWLAHWAPGMDGHTFPEGTGIRMEPGAALVVQMHYYSVEAPGEADRDTRLDFQFEAEVEKPAFHLPQTHGPWLNSGRNGTMVIPPEEQATYEVSDELSSLVGYASRITDVDEARIEGFEIHSANLHMHAFGHSGVISLTDADGRYQTLLSVPEWDLHWQRDFTFVEPKVFSREKMDGAELRVRCTYENPTDEVVYGGYGSYDEMCFNFSYIALQVGEQATDGAGH